MKLLKIEKAVLCGLVIAIMASSLSGFSVFSAQCNDIRGRVLRLHILANSDSKADQQLKLNVRDRILAQSSQLFKESKTKAEAEKNVRSKLPEIAKIAQAEIKKEGYSYKVSARLVHMYFTTRTYGDITLPAGDYDAVRITIGAAKGHNWWCVLFPSLCVPAARKTQDKALSDVLTTNEVRIVKGSGKPGIVIKFKTVELCEQFKSFLKSHGINFF
jgi:stage II sporulation protein R